MFLAASDLIALTGMGLQEVLGGLGLTDQVKCLAVELDDGPVQIPFAGLGVDLEPAGGIDEALYVLSVVELLSRIIGLGRLFRRFSRPLNLPNSHPITVADETVFPGFFGL